MYNGLNRQEDSIMGEYMNYMDEEVEEEELSEEEEEEAKEINKENQLPDYVPPYFPAFPVIIAAEDMNERHPQVMIEPIKAPSLPQQPQAAVTNITATDALPLPNIVKKKTRPIENPFIYLKPMEDSILVNDKDQPEALSLSISVEEENKKQPLTPTATADDSSSHVPKRRRKSETLAQLIDEVQESQSKIKDEKESKHKLVKDVQLIIDTTRKRAAPGNTMFSQEQRLLDRLTTELSDPLAVPKFMTPNLLMDIVVPPGQITPSSTLRLNMTGSSRKPSLGSITIEKPPRPTPTASRATTPIAEKEEENKPPSGSTDSLATPTTIKIVPISLATLSTADEKKPPKEKKPKASKKKLTISLPKPSKLSLDIPDTTISHDDLTASQPLPIDFAEQPASSTLSATTELPLSTTHSTTTTPKIRFKIKLPTPGTAEEPTPVKESTPPASPNSKTDIINCICENPFIDYGTFMIACDACRVWYHGTCVGIAESNQVEEWHCTRCRHPAVVPPKT